MKLTPQQYKVAEGISRGLRDKEIARELRLSPGTVRAYVHRALVCNRLGCRSQIAVAFIRGEFKLSDRRRPRKTHVQPPLPAHRAAYLRLVKENWDRRLRNA